MKIKNHEKKNEHMFTLALAHAHSKTKDENQWCVCLMYVFTV